MARYPGLLTTPQDKQQAVYQGLLNVGQNVGGYSDKPVSFAQQFSQGAGAFGSGYQDRIDQSKKDQLGDAQFQQVQAQIEQQQQAIEQAKKEQAEQAEQKRLQDLWSTMDGETSGPGGAGRTQDDALKAAFPEKYAEQQLQSMFPTPTNSRAASPIQNFAQRQKLVVEFGEGSPEVRRFDDYVRATQYKDTGASILKMDPTGGAPGVVAAKALKPGEEPEVKQAQAHASAVGSATGAEQGTAQAKLGASLASMPQLEKAVKTLKGLGADATYTVAGQAGDYVRKQTGQDPTKAATSRAKYIAHVKNNVLPLLRTTFGAAFTVQEGESLLATLGDPDMHPQEKNAVLDAFITDKREEIRTLTRQTGGESPDENSAAARKKKYGLK